MKILPPILAALIGGLVAYFIQENRIKSLQEDIAKLEETSADQAEKARHSPVSDKRTTPGAVTQSQRKVTSGSEQSKPEEKESSLKSMADVMQSEAGRAMIKQGIEAGIPMMYGDFIDSLNLDPEEAKYFKDLLTQRMLDQQQLGMKWMSANEQEREELTLAMEQSRKESSAKIDEFLQSEEDSAKFKKYEQQLPERQQMQGIRNALSNEPLTPEVEERLVDTLYQARLNSGEGNGSDEENWQQLGETGDFSIIENRWKATDEEIAKNVPNVLTPTQTETFLNHWKTARKMQTAQYKMGMEMMGMNKN